MLGDLAEGGVGVARLDACLHVAKEERVGRDWLLRLVGVPLLLSPPALPRPLLHDGDPAGGRVVVGGRGGGGGGVVVVRVGVP